LDESHSTAADANLRTGARRTAQAQQQPITQVAESAHGTSRKSWKELARAHNQEKAREIQVTGTKASSADEKSREGQTRGASLSPTTAVSALAVVICLILILARIFRRHAPLFSQALPPEALEILGRRFLDQRQSILLLRIGSRILVVGSSQAGLQGIGEVSDPMEVDLIAGMCRGSRNGSGLGTSFLGLLKGQSSPQKSTQQRNESRRRPEPRVTESPLSDAMSPARLSDPEQELVRRLRGAPATAAPQARGAEVFRE
jgi:flagellar biogenesis protein FliO